MKIIKYGRREADAGDALNGEAGNMAAEYFISVGKAELVLSTNIIYPLKRNLIEIA